VLVEPTTCKSGAPTLDGSKSSSTRIANSSTGRTVRSLMLQEVKMKKVKQLEFMVIIEARTNNGKLSTLIKQTRLLLRELTMTSVSISTDHSTLDQDCQ
jgi:hypothetical protein